MASKKTRKTRPAPPSRNVAALSIGAAALAIGGALLAFFACGRTAATGAEHAAPDLALDQPRPDAQRRAPVDFRPDPTAPIPASEREALRPATGPAPSLVADRGGLRSEVAAG